LAYIAFLPTLNIDLKLFAMTQHMALKKVVMLVYTIDKDEKWERGKKVNGR
jgi:hypothetical protein